MCPLKGAVAWPNGKPESSCLIFNLRSLVYSLVIYIGVDDLLNVMQRLRSWGEDVQIRGRDIRRMDKLRILIHAYLDCYVLVPSATL